MCFLRISLNNYEIINLMFNSMPKKGSSKKNVKKDIDDDSTSSDDNNQPYSRRHAPLGCENDKITKFLTNEILKQQKINYKNSVNKFLQDNGLIILSF